MITCSTQAIGNSIYQYGIPILILALLCCGITYFLCKIHYQKTILNKKFAKEDKEVKMSREKTLESKELIFANKNRRRILKACKRPTSASQLKKELGIAFGTLYHHLNILEQAGLVKKEQITDSKGKKKQGRETKIIILTQ